MYSSLSKSQHFSNMDTVVCSCFQFEQLFNFVMWQQVNFLPKDTFLDLTKIKSFADDKTSVAKIMLSQQDSVENIVGEEENAGHQHFLLFSHCFQKASFSGSLKVGIVW